MLKSTLVLQKTMTEKQMKRLLEKKLARADVEYLGRGVEVYYTKDAGWTWDANRQLYVSY